MPNFTKSVTSILYQVDAWLREPAVFHGHHMIQGIKRRLKAPKGTTSTPKQSQTGQGGNSTPPAPEVKQDQYI